MPPRLARSGFLSITMSSWPHSGSFDVLPLIFPRQVVGAVAAALRTAKVTDEDVAAAKKNMLSDLFTMLEDPLFMVENIGSQLLLSGDVMPAEKVPELIAGLTTADVQVEGGGDIIIIILIIQIILTILIIIMIPTPTPGCCQEALLSQVFSWSLRKPLYSSLPRHPLD